MDITHEQRVISVEVDPNLSAAEQLTATNEAAIGFCLVTKQFCTKIGGCALEVKVDAPGDGSANFTVVCSDKAGLLSEEVLPPEWRGDVAACFNLRATSVSTANDLQISVNNASNRIS